MNQTYIKKILQAPVYDVAVKTPLEHAPLLSQALNNRVLLKREDLQPVFSFKLRGAYNKIIQLTNEQCSQGIVTASAGNHAQGVALSAQALGIKATIVMPRTTPDIKIRNVKALDGNVILYGDTFDQAYQYAQKLVRKQAMTFIHPYDDDDVIAGQGTIGMEILQQESNRIDAIFVPVGGGGLIAGIAAYIKYLRPETRIIGVEPFDSASLYQALADNQRSRLDSVGLFADGVAVAQTGAIPFELCRTYVDQVIRVTSDEICAAIKDIFDDTRSIAEPSGALAVAGLKQYVAEFSIKDKTLIAINSGANTNFDRLRYIAERAETGREREVLIATTMTEQPGSFSRFCSLLESNNITEFSYRYADPEQARVFIGLELKDKQQLPTLLKQLERHGHHSEDLSDNEMAKLHIRYMVGGRSTARLKDEKLYRIEFPERPGALSGFLKNLDQNWNITLFHYRNHGAAYGRVLAGFQLDSSEQQRLQEQFSRLNISYLEETDNPAYNLFLN